MLVEGAVIPDNSMVVGMPGRVKRELSDEQIRGLLANAENYVKRGQRYRDSAR